MNQLRIPLNIWVDGSPDHRQILAFLHPDVNLSCAGTVFGYTFEENDITCL